MSDSEIVEKINEFLIEEFEIPAEKITPNAPLKETLELDSLDYVDLVVIIEGNFGIKVKQEDFTGIITFQNLYDYVISKTRQTSGT
jgi:acyl carrier protein